MSRNALILNNRATEEAGVGQLRSASGCGNYADLIRRVFRSHSVLAVIGANSGCQTDEVCRGIAGDLSGSGYRVVIVDVDTLLMSSSVPDPDGFAPGRVANVCTWPPAVDSVEFFSSSSKSLGESDWLASLRREFDAVLLNFRVIPTGARASLVARQADTAVLLTAAGSTTRQQVGRAQRHVELEGIHLAGCILMQRR
jgi:hypothetical protein